MRRGRSAGWRFNWLSARRRDRLRQGLTFPFLVAVIVFIAIASPEIGPDWLPPSLVIVPLLMGGVLLGQRAMRWLIALAAIALLYVGLRVGWRELRPGFLPVLLVAALVTDEFARRREELGVPAMRGEGMLLELRERLAQQGELPVLPDGWRAEFALETAGHAGFSGDFLVSCTRDGSRRLELALVDVSGKGFDVGTRSLMLSGAMGSLLGAVPPGEFLGAANDYLLRLDWGEGFATAVHIAVNLRTGDYLVESAGHPPAAHYEAGTGRWALSSASGMALGMFARADWSSERGRLREGDALLLYTDGVVEIPGRDLGHGIDRLLGEANALVLTGFEGAAERLIDAVGTDSKDDRAVVMLWRC